LVVNKPQALRDANEKFCTAWFPECCPPALVSRNANEIREFLAECHEVVLKPLDQMGGKSVFLLREGDENTNVVIENMTARGHIFCMVQKYLSQIKNGDKRIILIDGETIPHGLARIPAQNDFRGNLSAGAQGTGVKLTARDHWICQQVSPWLKRKGILFAGLDIIGEFLTEINVTSPTGIRELDSLFGLNISAKLLDAIEKRI
ncbi:MAG: glutathione synthase, partial [Pseudomonadota bacterium]